MSRATLALAVALAALPDRLACAADAGASAPSPESLASGCDRGNHAACTALGYHVASDQAFPPDMLRAFDLWRRACGAGHLPACLPYGQVLLTGHQPSELRRYVGGPRAAETIAVDRSEGRRVLSRACEEGHA